VIVGVPGATMAPSETSATSAASASRCSRRNSARCGLPISSSPSITKRTLSGQGAVEVAQRLDGLDVGEELALVVRGAAGPDLARRRSSGSKGGVVQASSGSAGCTS
jgi:hypothetical protein